MVKNSGTALEYTESPNDSEIRIRDLLSDYRLVLEQYHTSLHTALRPGLSRAEVINQLSRLPFAVSQEAIQLYCWADGVEDSTENLIPYSYFVPLETAISNFEYLLRHQVELEEIFPQKYRQSFPFLSDHSDGGYGLGATGEPCNGKIVQYNIHDEWTIGFNSLNDLITTLMEAYKRGLVDKDGEWDSIQFWDLVREMYPDLNNSSPSSDTVFGIEITPPSGWYLASDGASLSKGKTSAFITQLDSETHEQLLTQFSAPFVDMRTKQKIDRPKTKVQFGESIGWKIVSSQIEVSEMVQVDYFLEIPGGRAYIRVNSDLTEFDHAEFELALHTLRLKPNSQNVG